jgi:flagellar basal-body rod protein FlgG
MMRAMWSAAAGMNSQSMNMDTISNNLANVNTSGYKKARPQFQDLMYQTLNTAGANTSSTTTQPASLQLGHGSMLSGMVHDFTTGSLQQTDSKLDLAIQGNGFFRVLMTDGTFAYTRDGSFTLDQNGTVVNSSGNTLDPQITIPQDATSVTVAQDGTVSVIQAGQTTASQVGQITLSNFVNPNGLSLLGHNLYQATTASGDAIDGTPGQNGLGTIQQSALEMSNVDMAAEMVNMIIGQRAYEANSKTIQTVDSMLQLVNNLKRS